jgi:D-3-phosphoglycerate dehydrogenase
VTHRVVVSDTKMIDFALCRERLAEADAEPEPTFARSEAEMIDAAAGAAGLIVDVGTPVTERVFREVDPLRVVGRAGTGVDNVDVAAAAEHGVVVVNVPAYGTDEVATHTLSLLLAAVRRIPSYDRSTREGGWDWEVGRPTERTRGRTLGLVGFGDIPRRLARKASGLDVEVVASDPGVDATEMAHLGVERVDFEELLERSHYVSLHAPLYEGTRGMFDADAFERMRDDAVLVNTGRGGLIDEDALAAALDAGEIDSAAVDVLAEEPPVDSPLVGHEDTIVTPHAGWYSETAREELSRTVAADVARVLRGEEPENRIDPSLEWV